MDRSALAGVPLLLVPALGAVQGGYQPDSWVWAGALAAWAAGLGLVVTSGAGALVTAWRWPALAGVLVAWTLASTLWSAEPEQSLLEARRTLVYAAVVLALVVLARRHAAKTLVAGTHLAVSGLLVYALLRYLIGKHVGYPFEGYLLSQPLGYANAVGILAAMGLLLALSPFIDDAGVPARAVAGASAPPLALALTMSGSNASWLTLCLGFVVAVALAPRPAGVLRAGAMLAVPSCAVAVFGHVSRYATSGSPRVGGPTLAAAVVAAAVVAAIVGARTPRSSPSSHRRGRGLLVAAAGLIASAAVAVAFRGSTEPRASYYHVAWHEFLGHPALGSGAGTFGRYWVSSGLAGRWGGALDAHSLYLEMLAELGPVGLALTVALLLHPLRHAFASRLVPGVPAAAGAAVAFVVHAGLDWDWELPAVVVAGIACLAAVALAAGPVSDRTPSARARATALAYALVLGLAAIAGTASAAKPSAAPASRCHGPCHGLGPAVLDRPARN